MVASKKGCVYEFTWSNSLEIHAKEVRQRAEELKKNADPSIELKHDPTKDLPKVKSCKYRFSTKSKSIDGR